MTVPGLDPAEGATTTAARPKIFPHLWFDSQAEEAANYYAAIFPDSRVGTVVRYTEAGHEIHGMPAGSVMTVEFDLAGSHFMAVNGGPHFRFTPAISLFVTSSDASEIDSLWSRLLAGGEELMPLASYEWSPRYGWLRDRYGLTWQLMLEEGSSRRTAIAPCLTFVSQEGIAEEAMTLYTSLFPDSGIDTIARYPAGTPQSAGSVAHANFHLFGQRLMAMDTIPDYGRWSFNEAVSLMVECDNQQEIDRYWDVLTERGDPRAQQCGWLKDRFGVSWQVSPRVLGAMMTDPDVEKVERVTDAFMKMKKMDIAILERAYAGDG